MKKEGSGIFETMRAFKGNIVYLKQHLNRFTRSARILKLKIPYSQNKLKLMIEKSVKENKFGDARVKLLALKREGKTDIVVTVKKYVPFKAEKYRSGLRVCVSPVLHTGPSKATKVKSISRSLFELAYSRARKKKIDEAIMPDRNGFLVEGSRTNIFLVKDAMIYTASLGSGCLAGITRKAVFDLAGARKIKIYEKKITKNDFLAADEFFLTNSLLGVMPVSYCGRRKIGRKIPGPITASLMQGYADLLRGGKDA